MAVTVKNITPSALELIGLVPFTLLALFLGNSKDLLRAYGLTSSGEVVKQSTSQVVGSGLSVLDRFSATSSIVTFLIWGVVGILCFSIVQSLGQAYAGMRKNRALVSNRYVRPASFSANSFWRSVLLDFTVLACGLILLGIVLYGLLAVILPLSLQYGLGLFTQLSFSTIKDFLLGSVILYVWFLLLDITIRILVQRQRFNN